MRGKIVVLEMELLRSSAYRTMTSTAKDVLMDFMMKRRIKNHRDSKGNKITEIINNGEIEYCYSEAQKKGISRRAFRDALDQLVGRGFIDIVHSGQGGRKGDKSLYAISDRWNKWGKPGFKEQRRKKDLRQGIGFAAYWKSTSNRKVTPSGNVLDTPNTT